MHVPQGSPLLSRRKLVAAAVSGALLGSSWAVALRAATSQDTSPSLTIARDEASLAMLIEYRGRRIIVLDGADTGKLQELTELVTGFMKQRIDLLLATTPALAALPVAYRNRWQVQEVIGLPDSSQLSGMSLDSRRLDIEELAISSDQLPIGQWRGTTPSDVSHWYLTATFKGSRLLLTSTIHVVEQLPWSDDAISTCLVTNDSDVTREVVPALPDILAAPAEAGIFTAGEQDTGTRLVPLHREMPTTFQLTEEGIALPRTY